MFKCYVRKFKTPVRASETTASNIEPGELVHRGDLVAVLRQGRLLPPKGRWARPVVGPGVPAARPAGWYAGRAKGCHRAFLIGRTWNMQADGERIVDATSKASSPAGGVGLGKPT